MISRIEACLDGPIETKKAGLWCAMGKLMLFQSTTRVTERKRQGQLQVKTLSHIIDICNIHNINI